MQPAPSFDIVITGGLLFEGTGAAPFQADIGIVGERIAAIGDLSPAKARRTIVAKNLHVAPGFIDIHTHSDISAPFNPWQSSAIAMGVTSQVVGNCGISLGLALHDPLFAFEQRWLAAYGKHIEWSNLNEFLRYLEEHGIGTNFLPLVGHGTLRKRVMGMADRLPTDEELHAMCCLLEESLEAGAWGLSSGLEYLPSGYADVNELAALCSLVRKYNGIYATHLRNEGDTLVESVQEALEVASKAQVPLQLSHHKAEGIKNWGKTKITLAMVDRARAEGLDVQLDQYPYPAFMTSLVVQTLPRWAQQGTNEEMAARLKNPQFRCQIVNEILAAHPEWNDLEPWQNIWLGVCRGKPELQGRSIAELAQETQKHPVEYVLDLIVETEGFVSAINFSIGEEDIVRVMQHPYTAIGSDAVASQVNERSLQDQIHPRVYGTFPRVLGRYVRQQQVLSEAEAIYKMTGLPATRMGLTDRGFLRVGCYADITLYDPQRVIDTATFEHPHAYPIGIEWVLVNGTVALENGRLTNALAGKVLRANTCQPR